MALRNLSRILLSVCVLAGAVGLLNAQAPAGRPMAIDDLIGAVRIADPQLSPDGHTVAFVRTTTDLKTGARNADIWVVPADGSSEPRELIGGPRGESTPRFSPDGTRIAFISARDGAPQVYLAAADGGNVRQLTDLARGVQPPLVFSPDGRTVVFVSDVYPDCPDEACNRRRMEEAEQNPVKARRLTRLLYRHWDSWRENTRHHIFAVGVEGGEARDLTPGDYDSPPHFQEDAAIAFSPDSQHVAFVSNREGNDREAWTTNTDIWMVPVTGGDARKITANPAADVEPVFSRDGRTLFVRAQRRAAFESDRWYLDAYDLASRTTRTLFTTPDLSLGHYSLSKDGSTIWFTAQQEGRENLFRLPAAGGEPVRVMQGGMISSIQVGADALVFSRSSLTAPPDIYRAGLDGAALRPLTRANASWMKEVAFAEPESRTVAGDGQDPIQYWLIRPPGFDPSRRYPVVFLIHGGPQGAWMDAWSTRWNPALWAAQGYVVAAPNPRGSTGFGQQFVDEITGDWAGKVMTDLDAVFQAVSAMPFVDAGRMGVAGASYGGYAVNWIISQQPDRFRAAVSHDGVFNLESMSLSTEELWFTEWEFHGRPWDSRAREQFAKFSPHHHAHRIKTPTLIITNELDYRVPVDQGLQMFTALRRNGVPAEAIVFPDEGHWVLKALNSRYWHEAVFGWLQKHLLKG
ncbi:MAG: S9 family peptidase [Acidobacteria bacterium]|nr:S9 family peptidase [Acidobacteriota bacterium]MBA3885660.1 S9 family peptidase [Acidobacteriota bacterium]